MKALVGAFNQEKTLVGAFSVIVQPVVEPMEHCTALVADFVSEESRDPASTHNSIDSIDTALLHLHPSPTEPWFRDCLTSVVMSGGQASLNGLVAGAVYGALQGYHALPAQWIANIDRNFVMTLDKKINLLLDLMGVP